MDNRFSRMRADGGESSNIASRLTRGTMKQLSRMRIPFKAPSLIDKSKPYFSGIRRFGVSRLGAFYNDPYHALLNLSWGTFIFVFFSTYVIMYLSFAFVYWGQSDCIVASVNSPGNSSSIEEVTIQFQHALWVSSRVASTLGFDDIHPNPKCTGINFTVMVQVIASSLVNFIMLGVVFARFSAPFKRASTVRFSKVAAVARHPSGFWAITMRVANLRKHQILQPSVRMVVTAVDSITPSFYHHEQLAIDSKYKQLTNLELGFPAHITHVVTPDSFLYNLSLLEMDTRMMEVLVFVDGIDAMTSRHMSARIAYSTSDIFMNEQFAPMHLEMRGKKLGLDFGDFDKTIPALDPGLLMDLNEAGAAGGAAGAGAAGGGGLWQLRHQTFRRLAERYAHLGSAHAAVAAAAAAGMGAGGTSGATGDSSDANNGNHMHGSEDEIAGSITPKRTGNANSSGGGAMPVGGSMALTTSGMPFAVGRAGAQGAGAVSSILGINHGSNNRSSAWTSAHSQAHSPSAGSDGSSFIPLMAFQRGNAGNGGGAWQQPGQQGGGEHMQYSTAPLLGAGLFTESDSVTHLVPNHHAPSHFPGPLPTSTNPLEPEPPYRP